MKAEDLFFKMISKYDQNYPLVTTHYHKKGDEKNFTIYS